MSAAIAVTQIITRAICAQRNNDMLVDVNGFQKVSNGNLDVKINQSLLQRFRYGAEPSWQRVSRRTERS